jgi:hypothetical protein
MTPKKLRVSDKLSVPLEIVTGKTAILGMPGSGKSWLMMLLAELFLDASAQVVFLDPKGEAWALRLSADGKTPAYPIPVFGGDKGDFPLRPDMGRRIAETIVEGDYSAVLDVSGFISTELAQFGYDFAVRLFELKKRKPGAMSLMIDEVQDFIPQNPSERGMETKMLGAFERVAKQLRSKGVGMVMAGQRPQEINKKALNLAEYWFAFQMTGIQERETLEKIVREKDKTEAERLGQVLPSLEVGVAHVWSPRVLKVSAEFKIGARKTFDSSATPEVGARRVIARKLAPVDVKSLRQAMDDIVEQEKANDPAALQEMVAQLRRKNQTLQQRLDADAKKAPAPAKASPPKIVPAIKDSQLATIERTLARAEAIDEKFRTFADDLVTNVVGLFRRETTAVYEAAQRSVDAARAATESQPLRMAPFATESATGSPNPAADSFVAGTLREPASAGGDHHRKAPRTVEYIRPAQDGEPSSSVTAVTKAQIEIVQATALLSAAGVPAQPPLIGVVRRVSHTTGSFGDDMRKAIAGGFLERKDGELIITPAGRDLISKLPPIAEPIKSEGELHALLLERLSRVARPRAQIMEALIAFWPARMRRDNLGQTLGKSHTTGSFQDDLRKLRKAGLLTFEDKSTLRATDVLFPVSRVKK